jgi:DnaJ-domain-containing protein 1
MDNVQQAHYQQILELSQSMLNAGIAQEWLELARLEEERQALFNLTTNVSNGAPKEALVALIQKIQDSDNLLKEKIQACLEHTRILLRQPPEKPTL